jgi:hypothetical protein
MEFSFFLGFIETDKPGHIVKSTLFLCAATPYVDWRNRKKKANQSWRRRQCVPVKHRWTSIELHGYIHQTTISFTATKVTTSNPTRTHSLQYWNIKNRRHHQFHTIIFHEHGAHRCKITPTRTSTETTIQYYGKLYCDTVHVVLQAIQIIYLSVKIKTL